MATVEMDCTIVTCNLGPGGTQWKSPALPAGDAVAYIRDHVEWDYGAPEGDVGGGEPVKKTSCSCCRNGEKSIYHWNNCSVLGCRYLTDKKDGAECWDHKRAGVKKRLEIHLSKCEIVQHQPGPPAELTNHQEQPEHSHEDRDPPVHCLHESHAKEVHNVVATHVVPQERAHEEVSQVATVVEFDRTRVDMCSRVVKGPLLELNMKVHTDVANVMESEMVHAEVSQPATDTELDKTREDSSKSGQGYLGESAEFSVWPGQMIHTEVCQMATNTVNWKGEDSVSVVEASGFNMDLLEPLMELKNMHMVPKWDHG
jgi:hypothetical protein